MAKQYCGSFPVNKGLSKKLNMEGWIIYRDPEYGLYAYNEELNEEVSLQTYNETVSNVSEFTLSCWRDSINNREKMWTKGYIS